jgi:hypothetical protein
MSSHSSAALKRVEKVPLNGSKHHALFAMAASTQLDREISELLELQDSVIRKLNDILKKMDDTRSA